MNIRNKIIHVITRAKLTQGEIAAACGVSRVTINKLRHGRIDELARPTWNARVEKTLDTLLSLVDSGKLPLSNDKEKDQRTAAMEKVRAYVAAH